MTAAALAARPLVVPPTASATGNKCYEQKRTAEMVGNRLYTASLN